MRIFAAVGTQKFPFDRLIDALDEVSRLAGFRVFVQYGNSKRPSHCEGATFLDSTKYRGMLAAADVAVVHGGVGTMRSALSLGAKVVAVPRMASFGEHVDDHQFEIVSAFAERGYIVPCYDVSRLVEMIKEAASRDFARFEPDPCTIEDEISALAKNWGFAPFAYTDGGSTHR